MPCCSNDGGSYLKNLAVSGHRSSPTTIGPSLVGGLTGALTRVLLLCFGKIWDLSRNFFSWELPWTLTTVEKLDSEWINVHEGNFEDIVLWTFFFGPRSYWVSLFSLVEKWVEYQGVWVESWVFLPRGRSWCISSRVICTWTLGQGIIPFGNGIPMGPLRIGTPNSSWMVVVVLVHQGHLGS